MRPTSCSRELSRSSECDPALQAASQAPPAQAASSFHHGPPSPGAAPAWPCAQKPQTADRSPSWDECGLDTPCKDDPEQPEKLPETPASSVAGRHPVAPLCHTESPRDENC